MANGTDIEIKMIMDIAKLALKMKYTKKKAQKKETIFIFILSVKDVKKNLS